VRCPFVEKEACRNVSISNTVESINYVLEPKPRGYIVELFFCYLSTIEAGAFSKKSALARRSLFRGKFQVFAD
jgi:hypothetical protein